MMGNDNFMTNISRLLNHRLILDNDHDHCHE